jgi:hypothetical protein
MGGKGGSVCARYRPQAKGTDQISAHVGLTVVKPMSRKRPNEFPETIHLSKKTTGRCARQAAVVSLIGLAANLDDPLSQNLKKF